MSPCPDSTSKNKSERWKPPNTWRSPASAAEPVDMHQDRHRHGPWRILPRRCRPSSRAIPWGSSHSRGDDSLCDGRRGEPGTTEAALADDARRRRARGAPFDQASLSTPTTRRHRAPPPPESEHGRVGAACFGVRTSQEFDNPAALRPVMSFRSWVAQVREIRRGQTIGYGSLFTTPRDSRSRRCRSDSARAIRGRSSTRGSCLSTGAAARSWDACRSTSPPST